MNHFDWQIFLFNYSRLLGRSLVSIFGQQETK